MAEKEWSLLFLSGNYYTFIRLKRHVHTFVVQYFMNRQYQWYTKEMKHSRLSFVKFFLFNTVAGHLYKFELLISLDTTAIQNIPNQHTCVIGKRISTFPQRFVYVFIL